jgi:hypothetical protein
MVVVVVVLVLGIECTVVVVVGGIVEFGFRILRCRLARWGLRRCNAILRSVRRLALGLRSLLCGLLLPPLLLLAVDGRGSVGRGGRRCRGMAFCALGHMMQAQMESAAGVGGFSSGAVL